MIVRTSVGGRRIRVQLSNAYGSMALMVGAAHVALRAKDSAIVPGSDRTLTFSGKATGMIPPGALLVSDPVDLEAPGLSDLAVSLYVPGDTAASTMHATGLHTTYVSKAGDFTPQAEIADPATTTRSWYWLSSVDVLAPASTGLIVAYGDSITDGATSTPDTDRSWPSALARRLAANPATANLAIVNQGISGNRILRDLAGTNALARFDRDVLSQAGVKWLMFMEGINDIGRGTGPNAQPADAVTADDLIAGMRQIIERAHMHGIKVIGCTLTPFEGAGYQSETGEVMREALNLWIRSSAAFDAVVDFDAATRDTNNPKRFRDGFNITDHLHPNDAGYQAMAEAVDLSIFAPPAPATTQSRGSGRNR
jgi:lysophospholipase L1-like esterase